MRLGCDTGGTFTDLIVEQRDGGLAMYKAPTTPDDPVRGVLDAIGVAANAMGLSASQLLASAEMFIHGTTRAINAILTGTTARTALLVTQGHPEILVLREGGRREPFNNRVPFPAPYVPRSLTFEVRERIAFDGRLIERLDEAALIATLGHLGELRIEAVAVCLLWSISNPTHERRIGELIERYLPGIPYTLSHQVNPSLREYRRASSAAIDASLKPLMVKYMGELTTRLREAGFPGRVLVLTSQGGTRDAHELAAQPIHAINSGPSMAPVAGRHYAQLEGVSGDVIVADTGGTTYDVSLIRNGLVPFTRETWIGEPFRGHMTGFPSVDVKSVGAGGGSIAWVDEGRLLHVGPQSAGAVPGPACYAKGGTQPTVTDACIVLGYLDPEYFLGGTISLDPKAAWRAIEKHVAEPLGLSVHEAAHAVLVLATENMVQAIHDITINQGIDPTRATLIGGGGAAGLNSVFIARRLRCPHLIIPEVGAALSAAGALISDLTSEYRQIFFTATDRPDLPGCDDVLRVLEARCRIFLEGSASATSEYRIEFAVEARYRHQAWEIEVPVERRYFQSPPGLAEFVRTFHAMHEQIFAIRDESAPVEVVGWTARVRCKLGDAGSHRLTGGPRARARKTSRAAFFADRGVVDTPVFRVDALVPGQRLEGPALIESPFTTVVVDPAAQFEYTTNGSIVIGAC